MSDLPPNVRPAPDRHGKMRYRFRKAGYQSAYLPGAPGSAEMHRAYADIIAAKPPATETAETPAKVAPRSIDDLITRFKKTVRWKKKGARTQYKQAPNKGSLLHAGLHEKARQAGAVDRSWQKPPAGTKQKDLIGIPWMLAFALRADGWYLRQDIIWSKPNPMPESVRDRCTKAHEYLFLLSKGPRYHYDADAIAEPLGLASVARLAQNVGEQAGSERVPGKTNGAMKAVGRRAASNKTHKYATAYDEGDEVHRTKAGLVGFAERERAKVEAGDLVGTRNKRSVWEVATQPFSEAHFATYPPALIEPCILAGCPAGGVVLDPFFGAGTTGLVADRLQRDCIGIELNPEYAAIAERRIRGEAGMFADILAA